MLSVLLGAGASMEAGLPSANELTDLIVESFAGESRGLLQFIRRSVEGHRAISSRGFSDGDLDSESFFNTVNDLVCRDALDIAPFVSSWHPALSLLQEGREQRQQSAEQAFEELRKMPGSPFASAKLAAIIADPGDGAKIPESILHGMKKAVVENVQKIKSVEYLAPLVRLAEQQGKLTIATLNYDVCIERCCKDLSIAYSDGMRPEQTRKLRFNNAPVQLLKLHGSVSWDDQEDINLLTVAGLARPRPVVLFGGRNKLTAKWPFFDLFIYWRDLLERSRLLLVIGYSFRDDHVNAVLTRWMEHDKRRRIIIVDPGDIRQVQNHPFRQQILYESNTSNYHYVRTKKPSALRRANGFPPLPRVVHVKQKTGDALGQLSAILETWAPTTDLPRLPLL